MRERPEHPAAGDGAARVEGRRGVDPARARMLAEVAHGLRQPQKTLPSKYFYDTRGSHLFEEITRLPEYYLTRTERALLERWAPELVRDVAPRALAELGAGSATKTRLLLDAMRATAPDGVYVPIDVSAEFLEDTAVRLQADYERLDVIPVVGDMTQPIELPVSVPRPLLLALLGSTLGNFDPEEAVRLLARARALLGARDRMLVGVDLRKSRAELEAAYDDARGVTAEFNRNVLRVIDRELGADFDPDAFEHRAVYVEAPFYRVEMHLVARGAQSVCLPGVGIIHFADGESVRTEISCKYDRATIERYAEHAGLRVERWLEDEDARFALVLLAPVP